MTPYQLAKSGTEHAEQKAFFAFCNMAQNYGFNAAINERAYMTMADAEFLKSAPVPTLALIHAIHNQGHGDAVRGARAKAEGVKAGIPDIFWPHARFYHGLYIELKRTNKRGTKGRTSGKQDELIPMLRKQGYAVCICVGWQEAAAAVVAYYNGQSLDKWKE